MSDSYDRVQHLLLGWKVHVEGARAKADSCSDVPSRSGVETFASKTRDCGCKQTSRNRRILVAPEFIGSLVVGHHRTGLLSGHPHSPITEPPVGAHSA